VLIAGGGGGSASSESWWPGLDVPADVQEMDPDAMRELADELQGLLDDLQRNSPGSPQDLNDKAMRATGGEAFGRWDVGVAMQASYVDAHDKIMTCYHELVTQLAAAIQALRVEAGELEETDRSNVIRGEVPDTTGYPASPRGDVVTTPGMNA
jgi:hypothetical protein